MALPEIVLVIDPDGSAWEMPWPAETDRPGAITEALGGETKMRRCGKGILGFSSIHAQASGEEANPFATAAFLDQGVELDQPLFGAVLFARNPSKGSVIKALTPAQAANLIVVTGAHPA
ncbi:hypothetical protein ABIB25_003179 [Nakamurella sp. UYEF19]|uniref:hypothetical protein n=1 Tax=Nakamurella sp. UYEF19 TaxID=1756392 RepID=UPI0033945328